MLMHTYQQQLRFWAQLILSLFSQGLALKKSDTVTLHMSNLLSTLPVFSYSC